MKIVTKLLIIPTLMFTSQVMAMEIFGVDVSINSACEVSFETSQEKYSYKPTFEHKGICSVVNQAETNIPHIEYINGMYLLFVESAYETKEGCKSEYTALGISRNGDIYATERTKNSGGCNQDKELTAFEYFSNLVKSVGKLSNSAYMSESTPGKPNIYDTWVLEKVIYDDESANILESGNFVKIQQDYIVEIIKGHGKRRYPYTQKDRILSLKSGEEVITWEIVHHNEQELQIKTPVGLYVLTR